MSDSWTITVFQGCGGVNICSCQDIPLEEYCEERVIEVVPKSEIEKRDAELARLKAHPALVEYAKYLDIRP